METSRRASRYDLFKLIVALFLLLLFFLLLRWPMNRPFAIAPTLTAIPATTDVNPAVIAVTVTPGPPTVSAEPSIPMSPAEATSTPPSPPTSTSTASLTLTPTSEPPPAATNLPTPTEAPSIQPTTAGTSQTSSMTNACEEAASRSRLQPRMSAVILRRLNFRSSPGIQNNWLRTNIPGTQVEVVGGPECVPHGRGAYVWWQVRLPNGEVGWSAEGSIHGTFYFMEPGD